MHEAPINWWGLGSAFKDAPALGWYLLTFAIFLGLLVYFVRKPLALFLEARSLDVERAIEEAKMAKAQAEGRAAEYEARLRAIDGEVERLKAEFLKQGAAEKVAFEKSAAQLALQITKEAEENLVAEVRRALFSLKSDMADAVIAAAQHQLEKTSGTSADDSLKQVFTRDVSELRN